MDESLAKARSTSSGSVPACPRPTSKRSFLRSPNAAKWRRLFGKDRRELASSWAWIVLLVILGPLVGHAFVTAVESYAEASGASGGPAALSQGLSPLDGIIVPTFGAYAIAVILLFPFVAIRLVSSEKQNGA